MSWFRVTPDKSGAVTIGRYKEQLVREVAFPLPPLGEGGHYQAKLQRPHDEAPYPLASRVEGQELIWLVSLADTSDPGEGLVEIRWDGPNGETWKSPQYAVRIAKGLADPKEAPEAWAGFLQQVNRDAGRAESAADRAEALEKGYTEALEKAQKAAKDALGSQQEAERQATAAQEAATSSVAAADRAAESKGQAETARTGAEAAQAKAEEAAQGVAADREQIVANKSGLEAAQQELTATKEQLAETKATLATTQDELKKAQRAIQFQAELNKGQTWDFEEDTQEAYQRQVPSGAKAGAVMAVGGKTVGWNQLLNPQADTVNTITGQDYMFYADINGVKTSTIKVPNSSNGFNFGLKAYALIPRHAYILLAGIKYTTAASKTRIRFQHSGIASTSDTYVQIAKNWQQISAISTMTQGSSSAYLYIDVDTALAVGDTVELKNTRMVDLTLLYGPGNEPADTSDPRIAQIEAYAAAHPEYNTGELVSALVDEVDVMGANILRPSGTFPYSSGGITAIRNQDSTITINGKASGYPFFEVGRLQLQKGKTYFIPSATRIMLLKDGIRTIIHDNPQAFTPDKDYPDVFLEYAISPNQTFSNTVVALIVSVGSKRDYSPYSLTTHTIPSAVQALPGYGWSAGSVANTVERTENGWQYVQRVGSVDLGTLDYTKEENTFRAKLQGMQIVSTDVAFNGRCKSFISIRYRDSGTVDGTMSQDSAKRLVLIHSGYSNIASFLSYVRGTLLYYELSTPITTDITALMGDSLAPFAVEAGGSITMHHPKADEGFAVDVPAKIQYITKLSEVSANG